MLGPLSSQSSASMLTRELTSAASIPISGIVSPTSSSYRKFFPFLFSLPWPLLIITSASLLPWFSLNGLGFVQSYHVYLALLLWN